MASSSYSFHVEKNKFLFKSIYAISVVNIGATALVTEAATAIFGEAGVSAATGVMTVCISPSHETTPPPKHTHTHSCQLECLLVHHNYLVSGVMVHKLNVPALACV